jgi:hypothetical protein
VTRKDPMTTRKTSTIPTRVYSFGCLGPIQGATEEREQLLAAHRYYNSLVLIDRTRRSRYRRVRRCLLPDYERLEKALAEAVENMRVAPRAERSQAREAVRAAKGALREAKQLVAVAPGNKEFCARVAAHVGAAASTQDTVKNAVLSEMMTETAWSDHWKAEATFKRRVEHRANGGGPRIVERVNAEVLAEMLAEPEWPRFWKLTRRIDAAAVASHKRARRSSKLLCGTYLLVDAALERARMDSISDIRWHRFDGGGQLGVQIHGGMNLPGLMTVNSSVWVQQSDAGEWGVRRNRRNAIVGIRIANDAYGKPVYALYPIIMHRDLPHDARIKEVRVQIQRGARLRRQVQFVVESSQQGTWGALRRTSQPVPERHRGTRQGELLVTLIKDPSPGNNLLVVSAVSTVEGPSEVSLDRNVIERLDFCDGLLAIQDSEYDAALAVATQLAEQGVPEELAPSVRFISHWKSRGRLSRFVARLSDLVLGRTRCDAIWMDWTATNPQKRFPYRRVAQTFLRTMGLDEYQQDVVYLDWWRRQERHLEQWRSGQRDRALLSRNDSYRCWARRMANTHERLILDTTDLRPKRRYSHENGKSKQQPLTVVRSSLTSVNPPNEFAVEPVDMVRELRAKPGDAEAEAQKRAEIELRRNQARRAVGILKTYLLEVFGPTRVTIRERSGDALAVGISRTA